MAETFRRVRVVTEDSLDSETTQLAVTDGTSLRDTLYELIADVIANIGTGDSRSITTSVVWDAVVGLWLNRPTSLTRTSRQVFQWVESPGTSPDPRLDAFFSPSHDIVTLPDYRLISVEAPTGNGYGTSFGTGYGV